MASVTFWRHPVRWMKAHPASIRLSKKFVDIGFTLRLQDCFTCGYAILLVRADEHWCPRCHHGMLYPETDKQLGFKVAHYERIEESKPDPGAFQLESEEQA